MIVHRRGPSRETFFQAGRPLPTAGASPLRSPSSRNAIGFCRRSGSTYRHRPTGTRGTRPASIEDRLRSAGISAMPAASVERTTRPTENESSGAARRGEARRGGRSETRRRGREERREERSGERGHRGAWWGFAGEEWGMAAGEGRGNGTRRRGEGRSTSASPSLSPTSPLATLAERRKEGGQVEDSGGEQA